MADVLDKLAADILRDAARTIDKIRALAVESKWTAEDALERASKMFRDIADKREAAP